MGNEEGKIIIFLMSEDIQISDQDELMNGQTEVAQQINRWTDFIPDFRN